MEGKDVLSTVKGKKTTVTIVKPLMLSFMLKLHSRSRSVSDYLEFEDLLDHIDYLQISKCITA